MKKKFLSLALLGVAALSLSSCGYSEITFEEFKTQLDTNSKKEAPAYTKGKSSIEFKDYKVECSNDKLGAVMIASMNAGIIASIKDEGFTIADDYDLTKGYKSTIDLGTKEVKEIIADRYSATLLPDEVNGEGVKFYKNGDGLKYTFVTDEKGGETGSSIKSSASAYIDEYAFPAGQEGTFEMTMKGIGDFSLKISYFISLSYKLSK